MPLRPTYPPSCGRTGRSASILSGRARCRSIRRRSVGRPFGALGHAHADQNSFHLIAYDEDPLLDSGYYTPVGDPHRNNWSLQTKAHNTILVDGTGQPHGDTRGYGQITRFEETSDWVAMTGSAPAAYPKIALTRFDRHIVWLKGTDVQTYVIIDEIAGTGRQPHRFFNDRDRKTGKVFTVLFDVTADGGKGKRVREYRFDDTPVANGGVAQNGGYFLAINYARIARLRPVTGYIGVMDWTDLHNPILRGTTTVNAIDYMTDAFGRETAAFIEKPKGRPWLCYLAFNAVHAPLLAVKPEWKLDGVNLLPYLTGQNSGAPHEVLY